MGDDARQRWQQRYDAALAAGKVRDADFTTLSGVEVDPVYGPHDESAVPGFERIGYPGEFPFTRGLHATGYRGRAWTIRQFADVGVLNGTLQTDIFKEYIAQKEWLFAPEPHLRLIGDLMEHCAVHIPAYKPISVSGYHIREAGSTAAQELAFTLADGFAYVELGLSRGLDIEQFAPGLSFFFDSHIDFFEEIAKFRAARRIWARWLRDVYGAR